MWTSSSLGRPLRHGLAALALIGLASIPRVSLAQPHEAHEAGYIVRASTVPSQSFDAATARVHGIEPSPHRAVLNVTVSRAGQKTTENVRAQVRARARELTGREHAIEMKPVVSNGMTSYIGSFDFTPRQALTFEIVATPQPGGQPIGLTFKDTL